ncbi:MAG TPA: DNA adenine methylase [Actinomycetota bacterium]|nr:DNA adenine methylase [Actinomycetota bacterium]
MIKYLGSKRRLVPVLGELLSRAGARTAVDLFTGTTRVAQEFKRRGAEVWAVDTARYSEVFARCYVETDAAAVDGDVDEALDLLNALPGREGYVTRTFCRRARFFQPKNGRRIDAIRDEIRDRYAGSRLEPLLLTSLIEAADRVDSTTGVQMAYLKSWAPRSFADLELRRPALLPGPGHAVRDDAARAVAALPPVDVAYLDPPYNQHRYAANYHVWETLVAWDAPPAYGVARKRADLRHPAATSRFNRRRELPAALAEVVAGVRARVVILSFSDEGWIELPELVEIAAARGAVRVLAFDSRRYVGAQIGIHDPRGRRVGIVSHLRNTEYLLVAGDRPDVDEVARGFSGVPGASRASPRRCD